MNIISVKIDGLYLVAETEDKRFFLIKILPHDTLSTPIEIKL